MRSPLTASIALRNRPLRHFIAALLRVFVVLFSLHVSGLPGIAHELTCTVADQSDDCCPDCPLESDGKGCPSGCPLCHCSHGGVALPPASVARGVDAFGAAEPVLLRITRALVPSTPFIGGVYRPPRPRNALA